MRIILAMPYRTIPLKKNHGPFTDPWMPLFISGGFSLDCTEHSSKLSLLHRQVF
jgi:hypothetical protein